MESSDNDEPFLALDSMLEVSLVEGHTTTLDSAVLNGMNQLPRACNDDAFPETSMEEHACNSTTTCGCKKKCFESLGNEIISKAAIEFITCKTEVAENSYLKKLITIHVEFVDTNSTKSKFTKMQKSLFNIQAYGEKYAVCRRAFLSIYKISSHRLRKLYLELAAQNSNCNSKQKFLPAEISKIVQWNMDEEEEIFYQDLFEDLPQIRNLRLHCTKCDVHLGCYEGSNLYKHMHLGVLLCQKCFDFYSSGKFVVGEDGSEIYCRWCGEGGTVMCCSNCPNVFCKSCINHNFSKNVMREIVASSEWLCFLCNFRSLWEHRAVCRAAITYAASDTDVKQKLANISPRPGDDAKYCCSIDMDKSRLKPKLLRSSMPSHVTFAKFLTLEQRKIYRKEKIPTTTVSTITSTSANVTISECTSSNQIQEATQITNKSCPKKNLSIGVPFPIHISHENQKFLKPGNIYQIQSSNINGVPQVPAVHSSLLTNPCVSFQSENNATNSVLNTSVVPFMRLPLLRAQYAIITNSKPLYALQNQVPLQTLRNPVPRQTLQNPVPRQTLQNPVPRQTLQNPVPRQTLQNPVPRQTLQNPVLRQTLQNPVPLQTLQNPVPLQTFQNPVPLQTLPNSVPLQTLPNPVPFQTLPNPVSCPIYQNHNTSHPTVIHHYTNQSVNFCKPSNTAASVIAKEKQIPSKNHILAPVNDNDCQIISTTGLNNDFSTNLELNCEDNMYSSASSIINKNNNDYISRIRVRTPAMLQSIVINESGTNKFPSSEHSEASNNLLTSPDLKSQVLKAVLSDHMYVRTERNPQDWYNDTQTPLQFHVEPNNTEIMSNRIDSSTDSLENATKSNSFDINPSNNAPEPKSPNFKNCLPEIANLAKFMLARSLLLQEEINRMAYVDKSEFYFNNVPLFLENCKAGITKIEVNYIRERNKQLKNSGEPKEILLVHDDDVISIQPLCAEENCQPLCERDVISIQPLCAEENCQPLCERDVISIQPLCAEENCQSLCERDYSIQNASKKQINSKSSERKLKVTSSSHEDIQRNCIKRKLHDSDVLSNSKKQKVDNISDVVVVLERLPKDFLKKSESVDIKKAEEDRSKLNNNSEHKKCISKHNCIRPCYVRLVRLNERNINNNAE